MNEWTTRGQTLLSSAKKIHTDAIAAYAAKEFQRALLLLHEALKFRRSCLPESHPLIIATIDFMAHVAETAGEKDRALNLVRDLLRLTKQRFGPYHTETEHVLLRLARLLTEKGETKDVPSIEQEVWFMRTLSLSERSSANFEAALSNLDNGSPRLKARKYVMYEQPRSLVTSPDGDADALASPRPAVVDSGPLLPEPLQIRELAPKRVPILDNDEWIQDLQRKMDDRRHQREAKLKADLLEARSAAVTNSSRLKTLGALPPAS